MGKANFIRGQEFRPDVVVSQMLDIIFTEMIPAMLLRL